MQYVKSLVFNIKELFVKTFLIAAISFVVLALLFQLFFVFLEVSGRQNGLHKLLMKLLGELMELSKTIQITFGMKPKTIFG